jgi:acyl-CoA dehydrogenase
MVKIVAPAMCHRVADRALQAHGGMGVTQDTPINRIYMTSRYCQIADGPDEVHMSQLARRTIRDGF